MKLVELILATKELVDIIDELFWQHVVRSRSAPATLRSAAVPSHLSCGLRCALHQCSYARRWKYSSGFTVRRVLTAFSLAPLSGCW